MVASLLNELSSKATKELTNTGRFTHKQTASAFKAAPQATSCESVTIKALSLFKGTHSQFEQIAKWHKSGMQT